MIEVKLYQDESSDWYIVPNSVYDEMSDLEEQILEEVEEYSDKWYDLIELFTTKYGKYRTGGSLNNYQLHISEETLKELTGE